MTLRGALQRAIRPSTTRSTCGPLGEVPAQCRALLRHLHGRTAPAGSITSCPWSFRFPPGLRTWLASVHSRSWVSLPGSTCLDTFSRHGRGTPLPADAPSQLVTTGLFGQMRNPIMAAELCVIWAAGAVSRERGCHALRRCDERRGPRDRSSIRRGARASQALRQSYEEYCRNVPRWLPRLGRQR